MDEQDLQDLFYKTYYGKEILKCIQCGTCSASCPLTDQMDHAPREIFALIRDGDIKDALCSNTPWYCLSCYQCVVRCPKEIPVIDLMYCLKQMSVKHGFAIDSNKMPDLYQSFTYVVEQSGKITEPFLMAHYVFRHPLDVLLNIPVAIRLLKKGRLNFSLKQIKNRRRISSLLSARDGDI
mmetsp:Transcript_22084/g.10474  ORF Transcript_22084/g.10474 Transcript_22084/m.10474 type:complete len:180 (-) Transcript_22084:915-1454(-)